MYYIITDIRQKPFRVKNDESPLNALVLDVNLPLKSTDIIKVYAS